MSANSRSWKLRELLLQGFNFAAASFVAIVAMQTSHAATVTYNLDLSVPGQFSLYASSSMGDNAGLAFYSVPLSGPALSLDHRTPYIVNSANFAPAGFNVLRTPDSPGLITNPQILGSQDVISGPLANLIYGFGQTPGSWPPIVPLGFPDPTTSTNWTAPLLLATGTYNPSLGQPLINTNSVDLVANVFTAAGSRNTIVASIETNLLMPNQFPPVVNPTNSTVVNVINGDIVTTQFTATDVETPAGPFTFSDAQLAAYIPYRPFGSNPPFNGTVDSTGLFTWDTTGFHRGTYIIDVVATDLGGLSSVPGGQFTVIFYIPEPSSLVLCSVALTASLGWFRRRHI